MKDPIWRNIDLMVKRDNIMPKVLLIRSRNTDPAIRKVAHALYQEGYDVTLLIWERNGKCLTSFDCCGYRSEYFLFPAPQDKFSAIFYLPIWWAYELFYLLKVNPDIIHACDFDAQYPAIISKILKRQYLVYMIYDFYANNLPNGSFQWIRNMVRYFVALIERFGIGFSDLLILTDESRYEEVKGAKIKSIIYMYNTPEEIYKQKNLEVHSGSENKITIFYAGIINNHRGIQDMIAAVKDIENVILILAGPLIDRAILDNNTDKKVRYIGWIPTYEELINKTNEADILFRFSDPNHPKTKYESPNKLFEAMMCGKPIIVSGCSSMATIVQEEKCGIVIKYGNIQEIRGAILKLIINPKIREELGNNGKIAYGQKYAWFIMRKRLVCAYHQMVRTGEKNVY